MPDNDNPGANLLPMEDAKRMSPETKKRFMEAVEVVALNAVNQAKRINGEPAGPMVSSTSHQQSLSILGQALRHGCTSLGEMGARHMGMIAGRAALGVYLYNVLPSLGTFVDNPDITAAEGKAIVEAIEKLATVAAAMSGAGNKVEGPSKQ